MTVIYYKLDINNNILIYLYVLPKLYSNHYFIITVGMNYYNNDNINACSKLNFLQTIIIDFVIQLV